MQTKFKLNLYNLFSKPGPRKSGRLSAAPPVFVVLGASKWAATSSGSCSMSRGC